MVSFGKNKDEQATEKQKYRYEQTSVPDKEIADVLLTENNEPPLVAALAEPDGHEDIYELVVEEAKDNSNSASESEFANESLETASLNEQVATLCREYEAINQQLEKSLIISNELAKQLEKSKKVVAAGYIALGIAGFACLLGVGAVVAGVSMERDVNDLRNSLAALANQTTVIKEQSTLKNQAIAGQIAQLNGKVDKIFASDNLNSVLQVTQELKKQVNALANKNLAIMNHQPKESKISLPSLKLNSDTQSAAVNNQQADKTAPATKVDETQKKAQDANPAVLDDIETIPAKQKKHHWYQRLSKKFKRQQKAPKHAEHIDKTSKRPAPALPRLE